jgi:hypothetical protein
MPATYYHDQGGHVVDAPRRLRDRVSKRAAVAGCALALALGALGEWQLVAPVAAARDEVGARLEALAAENRRSEETLAGYDEFLREKAEVESRFREATAAIPTTEQLPSVLADVEALTAASNVRLVSFLPEAPKAAPALPESGPAGGPARGPLLRPPRRSRCASARCACSSRATTPTSRR